MKAKISLHIYKNGQKRKKNNLLMTPSAGDNVEQLDHKFTGGNTQWHNHSRKQLGISLKTQTYFP